MNYPCTGCGQCCKSVGATVATAVRLVENGDEDPLINEVAQFPFKTLPNGHCEQLLPDNSCAVYSNRPDICSIEKTHLKYFAHVNRKLYYLQGVDGCNSLIIESSLDEKYLIDPKLVQ